LSLVVLNLASSGNGPAAIAFIAGLSKVAAAGQPAHYIHMSGSSVISDGVLGESKSDKVWSDKDDIYSAELANAGWPFSVVDTGLVDAGLKEGVKTYIVAPSTICE